MPKNDGAFKVQFHKKNLALEMPNWATKMLKWAIKMPKLANVAIYLLPKKLAFLIPKYIYIYIFQCFYTKKNPALKLL